MNCPILGYTIPNPDGHPIPNPNSIPNLNMMGCEASL